jgi:hypothetical protein
MTKILNNPKAIIALLPIALLSLMSISAIPAAHAYGSTHLWETAFSGNCNNVSLCGGTFGFWGWCEFDSGGVGDCQVTQYGRASLGTPNNPVHVHAYITGWHIAASLFPGDPFSDFFLDSGTVTLTGPAVGGGPVTIPLSLAQSLGIVPADTGIPAAPGHYDFGAVLIGLPFGTHVPGIHYNIQVNQLG